jgi:hypothetical protein
MKPIANAAARKPGPWPFALATGGLAAALSLFLAAPSLAGAPPYDDCSDALEVFLGETAFTTIDATTDGPPPGCALSYGKDVWFKFTPSFNGQVAIGTCDDADFDTIISVYSGCGCGSFSLIQCNDENASCPDHTSRLVINVQAFQCYRIRVLGFAGESGLGVLTITCNDPGNAGCADQTAEGEEPGDRFGTTVSRGGRMNAGPKDEIVAGAPLNDFQGTNRGRVYALKGETLARLYAFNGKGDADQFGSAISATGDLNGDGRADIVIGAALHNAPGAGADSGRVWAYSGFDGSPLWNKKGANAGDKFGQAVAIVGDANDDGFEDVLVGAPFWDSPTKDNCGRAYLLSGEDGSIIWTVNGQTAQENFGFAVAGIGDLDDDGNADVAVGAPANSDSKGRVSFFSGPDHELFQRISGAQEGERFGTAIAGGDYTIGGVEFTYVVIGAPRYSTITQFRPGRVRLYTRRHTSPTCGTTLCAGPIIEGGNSGDQFGTSVAIGQVLGTAHPELLVGAPFADFNGTSSGAAYMYDTSNMSLAARFVGEFNGDRFGTSVALAGDIDGDTDVDLAFGAPYNDFAGNNNGRVYVFYNQSVPNALFAAPERTWRRFADVNGDDVVDATDLAAVIGSFGPCVSAPGSGQPCAADVDHSGEVDAMDLMRVIVEIQ